MRAITDVAGIAGDRLGLVSETETRRGKNKNAKQHD
jgi:hypothetical protein